MTEQTLIVLKPDAVERDLVNKIISRFEKQGFKVVKQKPFNFTQEMAKEFYSIHKSKPFFDELVSFITSGKVVAAVIEGDNVVATTRKIIGNTKPSEAAPGTIRGDFGKGITDNTIHASDSMESFEKEVKVVFE